MRILVLALVHNQPCGTKIATAAQVEEYKKALDNREPREALNHFVKELPQGNLSLSYDAKVLLKFWESGQGQKPIEKPKKLFKARQKKKELEKMAETHGTVVRAYVKTMKKIECDSSPSLRSQNSNVPVPYQILDKVSLMELGAKIIKDMEPYLEQMQD